MKITNDQIEHQEINSMIFALGNCLELNDEFIRSYCGKRVAELFLSIPEDQRESVLSGCILRGYFPGFVIGPQPDAIVLPHDEIEYQFEGNPEDAFETPDELSIHGDLAYLHTGYGLVLDVDCDKLAADIASAKI